MAAESEWADPASHGRPITFAAVVDALTCSLQVNGYKARAVLDTGSGISLISENFAKNCGFMRCGWDPPPPLMKVVTGATFSQP